MEYPHEKSEQTQRQVHDVHDAPLARQCQRPI